jgi:hypothetical protein
VAPVAPNLPSPVALQSSTPDRRLRGSGELMRPKKRRERGDRNGDRCFSFEGGSVARGKKEEGMGSLRARPREQERGRARATRCGRLTRGPERVGDPVSAAGCGGEREERLGGDEAPTRGPGWHSAGWCGFKPDFKQNLNSNVSNKFSNCVKFGRLEKYIPRLRKIEIKYGWREFEIRNNFPSKRFLRFQMDYELKFREASMTRISIEIHWKFLELWNLMKFG